jgi:hypothetical protein
MYCFIIFTITIAGGLIFPMLEKVVYNIIGKFIRTLSFKLDQIMYRKCFSR